MNEGLGLKILSCAFLFSGSSIVFVASHSNNVIGKVVFTALGLFYLVISLSILYLSFKEISDD